MDGRDIILSSMWKNDDGKRTWSVACGFVSGTKKEDGIYSLPLTSFLAGMKKLQDIDWSAAPNIDPYLLELISFITFSFSAKEKVLDKEKKGGEE